jgi:hypothetical protein
MSITAPSIENKLDALRSVVQARLEYEVALSELALVTVTNATDRQREVMHSLAGTLASATSLEDFDSSNITEADLATLEQQLGR